MLESENEPDCISRNPLERLITSDFEFWDNSLLIAEWIRVYDSFSFPDYLLPKLFPFCWINLNQKKRDFRIIGKFKRFV